MRKKKFLESLSKKISFVDENDKQKILNKYDKKITINMKSMSEKEAVDKFNIEKIVKKELIVFKFKSFFKKVFGKILVFLKFLYLKILNFTKLFTKRKNISNIRNKIKKEKQHTVNNANLKKKNNAYFKSFIIILYIFLILLLFLLGIFFFINIVAILDGVRIFGLISTTCLVILFIMLVLFILNGVLHNIKIDFQKFHVHFVVLIILLGCSVGYSMYEFYKLSEIDDFSDVYVMSGETNLFDLLEDDTLDIQFNSRYGNKYKIKYDDSLTGQVKIVTNYYRNYYDYVIKKNRGDVYISFHANNRNVISTLIEGLRDDKIYNLDELKRYDITIYINEIDKDRINVY